MPSRNHIKIRKKISELYLAKNITNSSFIKSESTGNSGGNLGDNLKVMSRAQPRRSFTMNFLRENEKINDDYQNELLKEYQKIYEKEYDYKICKYFEREETEEEFLKRKSYAETKLAKEISIKQDKDKKKKQTEKLLPNFTKGKLKDFIPSDLNMTEKYPKFSKWLSSIFQFIIDMNVRDVYTGENIWSKIYPQKDGVPVYNTSGQYWVKLYFMGKHRKVIIDDRMPCGMYEEFLLPKCEMIEEIWPSILTKALIKLFSFKYKCSDYIYEEVGDPSIIYALTGYIGEKFMLNLGSFENSSTDSSYNLDIVENITESPSFHILNNLLSGHAYEKKQKLLLGFNSSVPFEDEKFGFMSKLRDYKLFNDLNNDRKSQLIKKTSFVDLNILEDMSKKVPPKLLRTLTKKSSITMDKLLSEAKQELKVVKEYDFSEKITPFKKTNITKNFTLGESSTKTLVKEEKNLALLSSLNKPNINARSSLHLVNIEESPNPRKLGKDGINSSNRFQSIVGSYGGLGFDMISSKRRLSSSNILVIPTNERPDNQIYSDFAYSIVEIFCSDDFNMARLKPIDFSDLKRKILDARVSYKQLSKEDKKNYIQNLKDLKSKQNEEKTKRLDELKKPGNKFFLMKVKSDCIDRKSPPLNFQLEFSDKEIEMAKLCMANSWNFPPPNFFTDTYMTSHDVSSDNGPEDPKARHDIQSLNWTEEFYKEQILLNDLVKYENYKNINSRMKGLWMTIKKFSEIFKYFIVLHNPTFYPYEMTINNLYINFNQDLYSPDPEYSVFHLSPGKAETSNNKENLKNSCVLLLFEANTSSQMNFHSDKFRDINYYVILDILNSNCQSILQNRILCLSQFFSVFQYDYLNPEEHYYLIIKGSISPFGYHMKILSDHIIENLSYQSFLKMTQNYTSHSFNIQIPPIKENQFYLLARMKTTLKLDMNSKMMVTCSKLKDIYLKQFIEIYLFLLDDEEGLTYSKKRIFLDKEFYLSSIVNVYKYEEFKMFLIICCQPPFCVNESSLELEIISNFELNRPEQVEHIEPFEITDLYTPNKHGVVCKELIYVPTDTEVQTSIQFELVLNDHSFKEKIRMQIIVSKGEEILYEREFYNTMIAHSIIFDNTRRVVDPEAKKIENLPAIKKNSSMKLANLTNNENHPFHLTWVVDLSECPDYFTHNNNTNEDRTSWCMRIFSSESLAFVKDTLKDDNERSMKEHWEINEPGRSELAHIARVKFLMQLRKEKGEKLAEEEEVLLKKTRKRKNKILITNVQKEPDKKGKPVKKEEKINLNNKATVSSSMSLPETDPENSNKLTKPLPIASQHQSNYLKNFLDYAYDHRVVEKGIKYPMGNPAPYCRSEQQVKELKEDIDSKAENFQINVLKDIHSGMKEKKELVDSLIKDYQKALAKRNQRHCKYLKELQNRNDLKESLFKSKILDQ